MKATLTNEMKASIKDIAKKSAYKISDTNARYELWDDITRCMVYTSRHRTMRAAVAKAQAKLKVMHQMGRASAHYTLMIVGLKGTLHACQGFKRIDA